MIFDVNPSLNLTLAASIVEAPNHDGVTVEFLRFVIRIGAEVCDVAEWEADFLRKTDYNRRYVRGFLASDMDYYQDGLEAADRKPLPPIPWRRLLT